MTNQEIPAEAVVAATKVLYADKMSNHSGDNAPQIFDACEAVVRKILDAAAPYMMAYEEDTLRRTPTYANCATCDGGGDCA